MTNDALTLQMLDWIGKEPRPYAETMDAWRTSCPRLTIFEDAMSAGLIERVSAGQLSDARLRVTEAGQRYLAASAFGGRSAQTAGKTRPSRTSKRRKPSPMSAKQAGSAAVSQA
jgi:hypothetical protein